MNTPLDELIVASDGACTVCGPLAHRLWDYGRGDYPKPGTRDMLEPSHTPPRVSFWVLELTEPERGDRWITRAVQSTRDDALRYMGAGRVLVEVHPKGA